MSENFRIIKRKYLIAAIVASVVLGALCGIAVSCALAVAFKATGIEFFWALYIPIALVVAAGCGGLFYLILRPNDKRIAKKLDGRYGLNQKVQTMVEFSAEDGAMLRLQREQTDNALSEAAAKRVDLSLLWKFILIPIVAVAMLLCGIFVPAQKTGNPDTPYDMTLVQKTALTSLIKETESSDLEDGLKTSAVAALNELLNGLENAQSQSVMRKAVIAAVVIIDNLVVDADSYLKIVPSLKEENSLALLANAVNTGVTFFVGSNATTVVVSSFNVVKTYEAAADGEILAALESWKQSYNNKNLTENKDGDNRQPVTVKEAASVIKDYSDKIKAQTAKARYEQGEDSLADAFIGLTTALDKLVKEAGAGGESLGKENYNGKILGAFDAFAEACVQPLSTQSYNCVMNLYIRYSLAKIFGMDMDKDFGKCPALIIAPSSSGDGSGGNQGSRPGEDIQYAGEDLVLDKDTGELVPYGQLYDKFRAEVDSFIEDKKGDNPCPEELAIYIRQYFQLLFNGLEDGEDGN